MMFPRWRKCDTIVKNMTEEKKEQIQEKKEAQTKNNKKTFVIIGILLLIVIAFSFFLLKDKIFKKDPKYIYEVAVMMRSQNNSDPEEDVRTSLKKGDVLVVQKEGHNWSKTEKVSYLILKMELSEAEASKLTKSKTREIPEKELSEKKRERIKEEEKRAKKAGEKYVPELREETLVAREYRINMKESEELKDLKANDLIKGQPLKDIIFDWKIVEKK